MAKTASPQVPKDKVRIRMYRQGLGDCFLLTFSGDGGPHHILIDCGVLSGTPGGSQKILAVAENIKVETEGKLQALVATHEHWDHISGFYDAAKVFDPFDIGEIWVAWTEDSSNPTAQSLKRQNKLRLQAVHLAMAQLARTDEPRFQAGGQAVAELLGFFGGPTDVAGLAAFSDKTAEAMAKVTQRQKGPAPSYCKPGDVIRRNWLPGVNVYVLGPPEDLAMLHLLEGKVGKDIYGLTGADSAFSTALEAAALTAFGETPDPVTAGRIAADLPFNPTLQWPDTPEGKKKMQMDPQFAPLYKAYMDDKAKWRRIDQDWFLSVARLGLQLDSATNNTSLVLAFEFTDTKEVLLFAADAQIGNWKSWADIKAFKAEELLGRTIFYKVGHHGSHNATLMEGGLEAMNAPNLVAAIPVNQDFANNSKHWAMPAPPLYTRLQEKTKGRILRADAAWPSAADQPPPDLNLSAQDQQKWQNFAGKVKLDPKGLFIDFFIS